MKLYKHDFKLVVTIYYFLFGKAPVCVAFEKATELTYKVTIIYNEIKVKEFTSITPPSSSNARAALLEFLPPLLNIKP